MGPFVECPVAVVMRYREQRLRDKRPATELEALLELHALEKSHLTPSSMSEVARSLGWSRSKLRIALRRWGDAATLLGDLGVLPILPVPF